MASLICKTVRNWCGIGTLSYDENWKENLSEHNFTIFYLNGKKFKIELNKYGVAHVIDADGRWVLTGWIEDDGATFVFGGAMQRDHKIAPIAAAQILVAI